MRPPLYRSQLAKDLDEWIDLGLVAPGQREAILAQVDRGGGFGLAAALSVLGTALMAVALLSFVAANWQGLDKLPRLAIIFSALWLSFGVSFWGRMRRLEIVSETSFVVGLGAYGAAIWFVAQTYHLAGGLPDGLMLWALGAILASIAAGSHAGLTVGALLTIAWVVASWLLDSDRAFWLAPIGLGAALAYATRAGMTVALQAALFAALAWLIAASYRLAPDLSWSATDASAALAALALALWSALHLAGNRGDWPLRPARAALVIVTLAGTLIASLAGPGSALALAPWAMVALPLAGIVLVATVAAMASRRVRRIDALIALAIGLLLLALPLARAIVSMKIAALSLLGLELVWIIAMGLRRDDRLAVNGGFVGFGLWVIYLYASVFDSFLNSALFFAISGALLIGLAVSLDRVRRMVLVRAGGAA